MTATTLDDDAALSHRLRGWMLSTMAARGMTAEQWARAAGVDPTTITRFLRHPDRALPSTLTVDKLAAAADAPFVLGALSAGKRVEKAG
jgi:hypothetical protein